MYNEKEENSMKRISSRSFAKSASFAALFIVMLLINVAAAMAYYQSHNLSEIRNVDTNLNMGSYQVKASYVNATRIVGNNSGSGSFVSTAGVFGSGSSYGVYGKYNDLNFGYLGDASYGVVGMGSAAGIYGVGPGANTYAYIGYSGGYGVYASGDNYGVYGRNNLGYDGYLARGVFGAWGFGSVGVLGNASSSGGAYVASTGVQGIGGTYGVYGTGNTYGVYGTSSTHAGYFSGNVTVTQNLTANYLRANQNVTGTALCIGADCRNAWPVGNTSATGNTNYIPVFTSSSNIGNSVMYQSGSNIGIGTVSPDQALKVNGNANVSGTLYASNVSSNSPLRLQTKGTTRMYVSDTTGNVGIGSTNPQSTLSVGGDGVANAGIYATGGQYGVYGQWSAEDYGQLGGSGYGVYGNGTNYGLYGRSSNTAVYGDGIGAFSTGVYATGGLRGVYGGGPTGVYGSGTTNGVYGAHSSGNANGQLGSNGAGVTGVGTSYGVQGSHSSNNYGRLGDASYGVYGYYNTGTGSGYLGGSGTGAYGSGTNYGVFGVSNGGAGSYGVYGQGNGAGTYGVYGTDITGNVGALGYSLVSAGVYGDGNTYGLYGQGGDYGVYGTGTSYGVYGQGGTYAGFFSGTVNVTNKIHGYNSGGDAGVTGYEHVGATIYAIGRLGYFDGSKSIGVYGQSDANNFGYMGVTGFGVVGDANGPGTPVSGSGVYGTGSTYGVYGDTSTGTAGVVGNRGGSGTPVSGTGVYGTGSGYGVYGSGVTGVHGEYSTSISRYGRLGTNTAGAYGQFDSTNALGYLGYYSGVFYAGVYGTGTQYGGRFDNTNAVGDDFGAYGSATGVGGGTHYGGYFTASNGGTANYGAYGDGSTVGVVGNRGGAGTPVSGSGVYGTGSTYGVYGDYNNGYNLGFSGVGVYGTSTTGYGIIGVAGTPNVGSVISASTGVVGTGTFTGVAGVFNSSNYAYLGHNAGYGILAYGSVYSGYFFNAPVRVGNAGAVGYISGPGEMYVQNDLEVDGNIYGRYYTTGGTAGLTDTLSVRNSTDTGVCTITVTNGIITASTC